MNVEDIIRLWTMFLEIRQYCSLKFTAPIKRLVWFLGLNSCHDPGLLLDHKAFDSFPGLRSTPSASIPSNLHRLVPLCWFRWELVICILSIPLRAFRSSTSVVWPKIVGYKSEKMHKRYNSVPRLIFALQQRS